MSIVLDNLFTIRGPQRSIDPDPEIYCMSKFLGIYKLVRLDDPPFWHDHFKSAIVIAKTAEDAKLIHPQSGLWDYSNELGWVTMVEEDNDEYWSLLFNSWPDSLNDINVQLIGYANLDQKPGVVLANYISY